MKKLLLYLFCLTSSHLYGLTAEKELFNAIAEGDLTKVKAALQSDNVNVNATDENGFTPLMAAAFKKNEEIFNAILQKNPDLNITEQNGLNAFMVTVLVGNLNKVNTLIARNAPLNSQIPEKKNIDFTPGSTALILATIQPNLPIVKALIDAGADVTIKNTDGKTALDYAKERKAFLEGFPEDDNTRAYNALVELLTEKMPKTINNNLLESLNNLTVTLKRLGQTLR